MFLDILFPNKSIDITMILLPDICVIYYCHSLMRSLGIIDHTVITLVVNIIIIIIFLMANDNT